MPADRDGVERARDAGQNVVERNHGGVHPRLHRVAAMLADGQQLDAVAELAGELDVERGDGRNSLDVDVVEIDLHAVGQRSEDGQFVRRVQAFDIQRRIGLGKSGRLGLGQGLCKRDALLGDFGENVVAGAVEDPHHGVDLIGDQRFAQGFDDRHAAAHAGFEGQIHSVFGRGLQNLVAVLGQQRFVGRHHVLALAQRGQDRLFGEAFAAHHFNDDVDFRVLQDLARIADENTGPKGDAPIGGLVQVGDIFELERNAGVRFEQVLLLDQQTRHAGSDRAASDQP